MYRQLYIAMARYLLSNVKLIPVGLKTDANGNQSIDRSKNPDGKRKFLRGVLTNVQCFWDKPKVYVDFVPEHVEVFANYLSVANGGTQQEDQPLPESMKYVSGCWVDWKAPTPFYKRHLSSHPARPATATQVARPAIVAGSLVCGADNKTPIVYTELRMFCQYFIDEETGEKTWIPGFSPNEIGNQAMAAYCVPIASMQSTQMTDDDTEIITGQATAAVNEPSVFKPIDNNIPLV